MATTNPSNILSDLVAAAPGAGPVLAVWAHPDDESFCGAGLMMAARAAGRPVINVSATLGERGTDDPENWPPHRLGLRRKAELACALDHLGGAEAHFLGIEDGGCLDIDDRMGARLVANVIDLHRPSLIVTFDADGVTGHPDHQAIHRWVVRAVADTDPTIPVFGAATAQAWPADLIDPLHDVGAFFPGYPEHLVKGHTSSDLVRVTLDGDQLTQKLAALYAHRSQIERLRGRLGAIDFVRLFAAEAYRPVNPPARLLPGGGGNYGWRDEKDQLGRTAGFAAAVPQDRHGLVAVAG
jgi:LmbE family N-acetylglucosaminyl deacetylase